MARWAYDARANNHSIHRSLWRCNSKSNDGPKHIQYGMVYFCSDRFAHNVWLDFGNYNRKLSYLLRAKDRHPCMGYWMAPNAILFNLLPSRNIALLDASSEQISAYDVRL